MKKKQNEIPRSDSLTGHSDQDFHLFINAFYSNQCFFRYTIKDADLSARILGSLSYWSFTNVDVHLMFGQLCFYYMS